MAYWSTQLCQVVQWVVRRRCEARLLRTEGDEEEEGEEEGEVYSKKPSSSIR